MQAAVQGWRKGAQSLRTGPKTLFSNANEPAHLELPRFGLVFKRHDVVHRVRWRSAHHRLRSSGIPETYGRRCCDPQRHPAICSQDVSAAHGMEREGGRCQRRGFSAGRGSQRGRRLTPADLRHIPQDDQLESTIGEVLALLKKHKTFSTGL